MNPNGRAEAVQINPIPLSPQGWPELLYAEWSDTRATLHLWTQIVGKVKLQFIPWVNHSWQVPLHLTARGLGTLPIPIGDEVIELEFDFIAHRLAARSSWGWKGWIALEPQTVADFYVQVIELFESMGVDIRLNEKPCELPNPIRFSADHVHASYDADATHRFWRALIQIDRVFKLFRTGFLGKVSPVHFFWGGFDLAVTRFSGRSAPAHAPIPGLPDAVTREAYSQEVCSAGFWPGSEAFPEAVFYSYAYPEPPGYRMRSVTPGAYFDEIFGEFFLPYEAVRSATDPEALLIDFLSSTYEAVAETGRWDRSALECPLGIPGRPRDVT